MRKLILGGAQFGDGYGSIVKTGKLATEEIDAILLSAIAGGCKFLDIAMSYNNSIQNVGKSELKSQFSFINKIAFRNKPENLEEALRDSLQTLGVAEFEGILIHDWAVLSENERFAALKFLDKLKWIGVTKNVGVSVYDTEELHNCLGGIDIIQAPLNFYKRTFVKNNIARELKSLGVKFHARSIFNQGILLNIDRQIRERFPEIEEFESYCANNNLTRLEGALSFFDNQDLFDCLVIGVSSVSDLNAIIMAKSFRIQNFQCDWEYIYRKEIADPRTWSN
jgi:aryl-alcohol dehydrogenase-like predicted oxidoreductase